MRTSMLAFSIALIATACASTVPAQAQWDRNEAPRMADVLPCPQGVSERFTTADAEALWPSATSFDWDEPPSLSAAPNLRLPELKGRGEVLVAMHIDATGVVRDARVVCSDNADFEDSALYSARQTRFAPASKSGRPIESIAFFPLTFNAGD